MKKGNKTKNHQLFWKEFWRTIKYFLVAASAGLIQFVVNVLLFKVTPMAYWICYDIALVLSVIWNFTINRKATFKSVGNIPKAMLKVLGYYAVFGPIATLAVVYVKEDNPYYWLITIGLILINGVTEYLFMRLFVFKNEIDTAPVKDKKNAKPFNFRMFYMISSISVVFLSILIIIFNFIRAIAPAILILDILYLVLVLAYAVAIFVMEVKKVDKEPKVTNKEKRRWGDRKDAKLIRDLDGLHLAMAHCYPRRTDNEAYISEQIDLEPIKKWIEAHTDEEFKYTFFHVIVAALLKLLIVRPKLNRFISNRRYYQKNERSIGFIVKRQFSDDGAEGMAIIKAEEKTNIFDVHNAIKARVIPCKQGKNSGTEDALDVFNKMPHWLVKIIFNVIRFMSDKGKLPSSLIEGDSNHCSAFVTNLGSIGLKCGYHHLANYGTNSIFVVIGQKKMTPFYDEKGKVTMKETLDLGLTIDERIADGYYYSKSVKILKKVLENPELLELPFETEVEIQ